MSKNRPNIVCVITDDQGYGDLECHGNSILKTPNIDKFYANSIRFTNYHVGPTCAPTRAGIMSGHYANSTGVWHTVGGRSLMRDDEVTLADVFSENGYKTGIFGKWHLGDNYPYRPQDRGFQEVVTHGGGGISQAPDYWKNDYFDDTYYVNGNPKKFDGYCTDVWFQEAWKFIEENKEKPFMCFITPNAPHSPYNVPKKYSSMYKDKLKNIDRAHFYGMITNIDENFGKLEQKLMELGIYEDTIIIFMTDNGSSCIDNEAHTCGFRGFKGSEYEGGHRVPFFIKWANGKFLSPRDIDKLVSHVDLMPTLMDLCKIDLSNYRNLDFHGISLKELLTNNNPKWEDRCVTVDSQRLTNPVKWRKSAVMTQKWRLINGKELYDIKKDKGQKNDISSKHEDVVERLRAEYEKWWDLVSVKIEEEIPISIGNESLKTVCLRSHDWRPINQEKITDPYIEENNDYLAWSQAQIRMGMGKKGYWEIDVEKSGKYRFELRRWPIEENRAICGGIEKSDKGWMSDVILEKYKEIYSGGKAMDLDEACIEIGDVKQNKKIKKDDKKVTFNIDLKKGRYHLKAWFIGDKGLEKGAYYVYVKTY